MKLNFYFIFFIVFLLCCPLFAKPKKKLANIEELYLVSIKMNAVCDNKKDVIRFLDIGFAGPAFLNSLLSNFHLNNEKVKMSQGQFISGFKNHRKKIIYDPYWIYFENNFDLEKLSDVNRRMIREQTSVDHEIKLELTTSLWEQRVSGTYTIYFQNKKIDTGSINATSTYIIKDEDSPYVTKYDAKLNDFQNSLDHRGEILKLYSELGKEIGEQLRLLFVKETKSVKKKSSPQKKRRKKSKQGLKFWDIIKPQY